MALAKTRPKLAVGVHLTLTEQRPLTGSAAGSLVGADGRFPPHLVQFAGRHMRGKVVLAQVRAELDAQIRKVRDAGIAVSHLDGHQHVHVLPGIAAIVAELAAAYGIRAVRYPTERVRAYMLRHPGNARRLTEQVVLGAVCALSPLRALRRSDSFVGFYYGGRLDEDNLATVLGGYPRAAPSSSCVIRAATIRAPPRATGSTRGPRNEPPSRARESARWSRRAASSSCRIAII